MLFKLRDPVRRVRVIHKDAIIPIGIGQNMRIIKGEARLHRELLLLLLTLTLIAAASIHSHLFALPEIAESDQFIAARRQQILSILAKLNRAHRLSSVPLLEHIHHFHASAIIKAHISATGTRGKHIAIETASNAVDMEIAVVILLRNVSLLLLDIVQPHIARVAASNHKLAACMKLRRAHIEALFDSTNRFIAGFGGVKLMKRNAAVIAATHLSMHVHLRIKVDLVDCVLCVVGIQHV
mmetsp:Transcript_11254/g.18071  ORF Transcript_11254/g.18071 Transcript_11254/m.18071 type:complete len:239 (-) Transcript_11254:757-1473(-)